MSKLIVNFVKEQKLYHYEYSRNKTRLVQEDR